MYTYCIFETKSGFFGMVALDRRLTATYLPDRISTLRAAILKKWPQANEDPDLFPVFRRQVIDYYAGKRVRFAVSVNLEGVPPFRRAVLEACRDVPHGATASYAELARAAGNASATRAAGSAMAHNPLPLVIPCHRVLRADGSIGGFSSPKGLDEKRRMLLLEGIALNASRPATRAARRAPDRHRMPAGRTR